MDETNIKQLLVDVDRKLSQLRSDIRRVVTKDEFYDTTDEVKSMIKRHEQELAVCNFRLSRIEKRFGIR